MKPTAREAGVQHLRSGMRHRRLSRLCLRVARRGIRRCPRPHRREAHQDRDLLRPGPRPAPAPARVDESLPPRHRAAYRARRYDLRAGSGRSFRLHPHQPPFGTKGANQAPDRDDFTIETSNKQLNFVQHVLTALKPGGRAALVLPDNCLFEEKAGEVFEILMQDCALHTVLRLPRGTFTPYSQGVKANVMFLQKGRPTEHVWIFDARSNVLGITKRTAHLPRTTSPSLSNVTAPIRTA